MNESKAHRSRKKPKSIQWISKVVVATKPGKIRICLDPQKLNKVIQRPKFLIPGLEKLLQNEKDGFYQLKLVFTTPSAN